MKDTLFPLDPRDTPIYGVQETAAYVGVPRSTLRHWLKPARDAQAIIDAADPDTPRLSFYNLLEAHVLSAATKRNVPLVRIRRAVETLRQIFPGSVHPLIEHELYTARKYRSLFIKELTGEVTNVSFGGQYEFSRFLEKFLQRIERDQQGLPIRLRPADTRHIVIDLRVSGGRPVVQGTGVLAEMLASRNRAGESIAELAHDYGLEPSDVKEAIRYAAA